MNGGRSAQEGLAREQLVGEMPVIWEFYPTMACNLKCSYCYLSLPENPFEGRIKPQYSDEQLREFVDRYVRDADMISFIGGKTFAAPSWLKKFFGLLDSKNLDLRYHALTNGTLLRKVPLEALRRFTYMTVSVDGDEETTDKHRGEGVFEAATSGLQSLRELGIPTIGRITVMPDNDLLVMQR